MAAADKFADQYVGPGLTGALDWPATNAVAVTPNDSNDLTFMPRAVWVGTGGDLSVVMKDGATVTIPGVPDGTLLPIRVDRIRATGTTASGIVIFE